MRQAFCEIFRRDALLSVFSDFHQATAVVFWLSTYRSRSALSNSTRLPIFSDGTALPHARLLAAQIVQPRYAAAARIPIKRGCTPASWFVFATEHSLSFKCGFRPLDLRGGLDPVGILVDQNYMPTARRAVSRRKLSARVSKVSFDRIAQKYRKSKQKCGVRSVRHLTISKASSTVTRLLPAKKT